MPCPTAVSKELVGCSVLHVPCPTAVYEELVGCGELHVPCPTAVYEELVGVAGSALVVEVCAVSEDDVVEDDAFLNDVLNDGSGRVASTPCSLPSPYSA